MILFLRFWAILVGAAALAMTALAVGWTGLFPDLPSPAQWPEGPGAILAAAVAAKGWVATAYLWAVANQKSESRG